ncbi:MAG TPA: DoxX family protein [Candidatus Methylacidiphilales bacterium]|jgi:putative oxidoreductase|nr:DoxX family protein [Candidatus Methylacidiphilales bacterium]
MNDLPNPLVSLIGYLYGLLVFVGNHLQSFALYLVRFGFGLPLAEDGLGKLLHVPKVTDYFTSLGIPFPEQNVYLVSYTEMIGGILLALGLCTRLTAVPLLFNFIVAYLTTEMDGLKNLLYFNPDEVFNDAAFPDLVLSIVALAFGPGAFSLDYLICLWRKKEWHGPRL